jgi:hypothetical protein
VIDPPPTRKLTIIAKDPGFRLGGPDGPMAFVQVPVPAEILAKGPIGYRIKIVDYNATERRAYIDRQDYQDRNGDLVDPFAPPDGDLLNPDYQKRLLADPNFHAQNAYAIAMRTLGAFERALGRRVGWSSGGHQLHIAPHAFAQANAFYSEPDRALLFGYFRREDGSPVFTSLSHDIIAHETTHAILDGLRSRYTEPSGPDQAAFHEGFADIVALLSIFSLPEVVAAAIGKAEELAVNDKIIKLVAADTLTPQAIRESILLGVARQVGDELEPGQKKALRRSVQIGPADGMEMRFADDEHDRGEVFAAAMMNTFVTLWVDRIGELGRFKGDFYNLKSVVEEGAKLAGQLLTMSIRALDYCPPTDIDFEQYLAGLLTADREVVPNDDRGYRKTVRETFEAYGISPLGEACDEEGCWKRYPYLGPGAPALVYARSNYAAMTRSPDELFRFLWENRHALRINERAYTEVLSIDASSRAGPDGIAVHETVCQYVERLDIFGAEFKSYFEVERPEGMSSRARITAYGGGVVILDQYGQVKYHIANRIMDGARQLKRAEYLFDTGQLGETDQRLRFGLTHQHRMGG